MKFLSNSLKILFSALGLISVTFLGCGQKSVTNQSILIESPAGETTSIEKSSDRSQIQKPNQETNTAEEKAQNEILPTIIIPQAVPTISPKLPANKSSELSSKPANFSPAIPAPKPVVPKFKESGSKSNLDVTKKSENKPSINSKFDVPKVVGKINFQIDIEEVASASQLGQVSIVGPSIVHLEDGRYRLYIQGRADKTKEISEGVNIISMISTDGIDWEPEPGIRIHRGAQESDVDLEAGEPEVYLGRNGKYYMAYTGRFFGINRQGQSQKMHRVVFAVSDDGYEWTKLNINYADEKNINDFASSADVHFIEGKFVMYYTGQRNIIRASSEDGLDWSREEIAFSAGHDSTMVKYDDVYYTFLIMPKDLKYGKNPDKKSVDRLMMAISNDGIHWSRNYYQIEVKNSDGLELDYREIEDPGSMILPDGSLRVFLNSLGGKSIYSVKPIDSMPKP